MCTSHSSHISSEPKEKQLAFENTELERNQKHWRWCYRCSHSGQPENSGGCHRLVFRHVWWGWMKLSLGSICTRQKLASLFSSLHFFRVWSKIGLSHPICLFPLMFSAESDSHLGLSAIIYANKTWRGFHKIMSIVYQISPNIVTRSCSNHREQKAPSTIIYTIINGVQCSP